MRILHKIIVLSLLMPDVFAASSAPNLTDGSSSARILRRSLGVTGGETGLDAPDLIGGAAAAPASASAAPATQDNPLADLRIGSRAASNGTGSQSSSATVVASPVSTVSPGVPMNNSKVTWGFIDPATQAAMEAEAASRASSLKHLGSKSKKASTSSRDVPGPPYIASAGAAPRASASTGGLIPDKSLADHSLSASTSTGAGAAPRASTSTGGLIPDKSLADHSLSASVDAAVPAPVIANGLLPDAALAKVYSLAGCSLATPSEAPDTEYPESPEISAGASTAKPAVVPASLPPVSQSAVALSGLFSLPAARAGAAVAERHLSAFPLGPVLQAGVTAKA